MQATPEGWFYLFVAIPFGVLGTISMKLSHGLQKWKPTICVAIFYFISFVAMTLALKNLEVSVVYAIWSGLGTVIVTLVGVFLFKESISVSKIVSLLLIVVGVIGMHLSHAYQ